tara:strand:- start:409 stop:792 length:384 start_codon:yes stop_codon:yes gene_type:complete
MTLVTETPDSDLQATERTRKLAFWLVSVIIAFFVLWWSFDLLQLWVKQGEELSSKQEELTSITVENAELEGKRDALYSPEKIEQLARQNYGFVRPGEEAYAVPPPAPEPVRLPANWPFTHLAQTLGG